MGYAHMHFGTRSGYRHLFYLRTRPVPSETDDGASAETGMEDYTSLLVTYQGQIFCI